MNKVEESEPYLMRIVLTWENEDLDLDIFVDFDDIEKGDLCSVGFFNSRCSGVTGNFDTKVPGILAETVTLYSLLQNKYIIYVGQYLKKNSFNQPGIE
jgi:uncharacterized protein YfaP (DUF2135 family)